MHSFENNYMTDYTQSFQHILKQTVDLIDQTEQMMNQRVNSEVQSLIIKHLSTKSNENK